MKKLKLSLQQVNNSEVLTRQQMKKVVGGLQGEGSGSGAGSGGDCATNGQTCNTKTRPTTQCCSGLVCGDGTCWIGTF